MDIDNGILLISQVESVITETARSGIDSKSYSLTISTKSGLTYVRTCGLNEDGRQRAEDITQYIMDQTELRSFSP